MNSYFFDDRIDKELNHAKEVYVCVVSFKKFLFMNDFLLKRKLCNNLFDTRKGGFDYRQGGASENLL